MIEFYINGLCNTVADFSYIQNRLTFEGVEETPSSKHGIRYHNFIVAFILRLFSNKKIVTIKDIDEKIYYVNRGSLSNWLARNHDDLRDSSKEDMLSVNEHVMSNWLNEILTKKSPEYIVEIGKLKNELQLKENQKKHEEKNGCKAIAHCQLLLEIENLKDKLTKAEIKRIENQAL